MDDVRRPAGRNAQWVAKHFPRVEFTCGFCGGRVLVRGYYARNGCGTNLRPRPPPVRFHGRCYRIVRSGLLPSDPMAKAIWQMRFGR